MSDHVLLLVGAALTGLWGASHLFPTRGVVNGFGDISPDNRHIITMEWIVEGVFLIFMGALVAAVTFVDHDGAVSQAVFAACVIALLVMAAVSAFTGFKVKFIVFKLCPVIFSASAALIGAGALI